MKADERYISRCFALARQGAGDVAPNPMVGAVVVCGDKIIGEGYHEHYGQAHAERNAIFSVKNQDLLEKSTIYVNLEPCSHYGKTPPCAELIIEKKIPRVVISNADPCPKVAGGGIKMLREAGVEVLLGVLEKEGWEVNKRFFTFHEKKRPYIILKWAQSADGFIDRIRTDNQTSPIHFSTSETQQINHQLRAEEAAILVGTNTVLLDNPRLTVRHSKGNNPLRVAIDRNRKIPDNFHIYNDEAEMLIFTEKSQSKRKNITFVPIDFSQNIVPQMLDELYRRKILSLIVEGGAKTLQSFIDSNLWDEARVETAPFNLENGVSAPRLNDILLTERIIFWENILNIYKNTIGG